MNVNVSIISSVLFYLGFVNSVNLIQKYEKKWVAISQYEFVSEPFEEYDVCESSLLTRASICHAAITQLKTIDELDYDIFMNYVALMVSEPCMDVKVTVAKQHKGTNRYFVINQRVLNCFGSSAMFSFDNQDKTKLSYQKIKIYPSNLSEMMYFSHVVQENYEYYTLFKILENSYWAESKNVPDRVFLTPVPQIWSNRANLYEILYPEWLLMGQYSVKPDNIVNLSSDINFIKICYVIDNYLEPKKVIVNVEPAYVPKPNREELTVLLRSPDYSVSNPVRMEAYSCNYVLASGSTSIITNYRIAAGPQDNSLLLLQYTGYVDDYQRPSFEVVELIQHVDMDYVKFFFSGEY